MNRTPEQILHQTNSLAREFYRLLGYTTREGYRFDQATHPQERVCWQMACVAQLELTETDLEDVITELND